MFGRSVAASLVFIVLLSGCLADGGQVNDRPTRKAVAGKNPNQPTPEIATSRNFPWSELHDHRIEFAPDEGNWAVLRIRFPSEAREPGQSNSSFQVRYAWAVEAAGAKDAFMMSGWRTGMNASANLDATPMTGDRQGGGGTITGGCSCDVFAPEYYLLVGSREGEVRASFGVLDGDDSFAPDTLLARPVIKVAPDFQGEGAAFGRTFRSTDPVGASTWYDRGHIFHQESETVGPISNQRHVRVNASADLSRPGIMWARYQGGGGGEADGSYVFRFGERTYQNEATASATSVVPGPPSWFLQFKTPTGAMSFEFHQNVTGTEANSNVFIGQIHTSWVWLDADLGEVYGWNWNPFDARG